MTYRLPESEPEQRLVDEVLRLARSSADRYPRVIMITADGDLSKGDYWRAWHSDQGAVFYSGVKHG